MGCFVCCVAPDGVEWLVAARFFLFEIALFFYLFFILVYFLKVLKKDILVI